MVALNGARTVVLGLSFAMVVTGCKKTPATDDASLNTQVQQSLSADPNLSGQPIQASVANGVVTLNGTVTSDSARTIASGDAAQIAGVKTVVNNLVVQPPQPGVTTAIPALQPQPRESTGQDEEAVGRDSAIHAAAARAHRAQRARSAARRRSRASSPGSPGAAAAATRRPRRSARHHSARRHRDSGSHYADPGQQDHPERRQIYRGNRLRHHRRRHGCSSPGHSGHRPCGRGAGRRPLQRQRAADDLAQSPSTTGANASTAPPSPTPSKARAAARTPPKRLAAGPPSAPSSEASWEAAKERPSAQRPAAEWERARTPLPAASRFRSSRRQSSASSCRTPSSYTSPRVEARRMPPARRSNGTTTSKTGKRIRTEHRTAIAAVKSNARIATRSDLLAHPGLSRLRASAQAPGGIPAPGMSPHSGATPKEPRPASNRASPNRSLRSLLPKAKNTPAGFLAFTLHAHLPYVVNHGTWPHGMEWLHEAAAETYLPLLRVLAQPRARRRSRQLQHQPLAHPAGAAGAPVLYRRVPQVPDPQDRSPRARTRPTSSSPATSTSPRRRASGAASSPPRWTISMRSTATSFRAFATSTTPA